MSKVCEAGGETDFPSALPTTLRTVPEAVSSHVTERGHAVWPDVIENCVEAVILVTTKKTPTFYFSLRSPYSWLAYKELTEHYGDVAAVLELVPFWEPDGQSSEMLAKRGREFPYSNMSRAKNLYVLQDVGRIVKQSGRSVTWPVDRDPVWEVPHLPYLVARKEGVGAEYVAALYHARWEQGRDICDRSTVAEVAEGIGIDPERMRSAADDPEVREEGVDVLERVCAEGVFGVPFFTCGRSRFWGLDRLGLFVEHLRAQQEPAVGLPEPTAGPVGLGVGSDDGHAGGCG